MFSKSFRIFSVVALAATPSFALAYDCSEPKKYIESVKAEVVSILDGKSSDSEKKNKLDGIFREVMDSQWMSKFVLGRSYNTLTPEQQKDYSSVYADYLSASYVERFKEYNGEVITVGNVKPVNNDFVVDSVIDRKNKSSVNVSYRVAKSGSCYKVKDINAEGISLINTQRQEFGSVVNSKGYEGLAEALKNKTEQYRAGKIKPTE